MFKAIRPSCCGNTRRTVFGRGVSVAKWIVPGTVLVFIPKCPLCVAAYIAAATGIGISFSAAANIRMLLIGACLGLILLGIFRIFFAKRRLL